MKTRTEKRCPKCGLVKPLTAFYFKPSLNGYAQYCKECYKVINKENYNYEKVLKYPNQYCSVKQKKDVFRLMENLGWIFIEETGAWYKPAVRNQDGTWNVKILK